MWYTDSTGNYDDSRWAGFWNEATGKAKPPFNMPNCGVPGHPNWYCNGTFVFTDDLNNGVYQFLGYEFHALTMTPTYKVLNPAFDVFEVTIDK